MFDAYSITGTTQL